jgi:ABC-type uncharacterized transport system permease subunit
MDLMLSLLIYIVLVLIVAAVVLWLIDYSPADGTLKRWLKWAVYAIAALAILKRLIPIMMTI